MKREMLFDFVVDKSAKTVFITREFDADLSLVWEAFTKREILDQWSAPQPFQARTKHMDFKVGGRRFYAMVSPDGQEQWQVQRYTAINPTTNFRYISAFADKDENVDPQWPGSEWDLNFSEQNGVTKLNITIRNESAARFDKMLEMGFREGFMALISNLETLLTTLSQHR
jgi:uncharacterized protein YndB with AHSA1/START domain